MFVMKTVHPSSASFSFILEYNKKGMIMKINLWQPLKSPLCCVQDAVTSVYIYIYIYCASSFQLLFRIKFSVISNYSLKVIRSVIWFDSVIRCLVRCESQLQNLYRNTLGNNSDDSKLVEKRQGESNGGSIEEGFIKVLKRRSKRFLRSYSSDAQDMSTNEEGGEIAGR